ncbi:MAG: signal peptidase I [Spirochaetia bacterium]
MMQRLALFLLIISSVIVASYFGFGLSSYRVLENSMTPGIQEGDLIIVDKIFWKLREPKMNSMLTVYNKGNPIIKRAVLVGEQNIKIDKDYGIYLNGDYLPLNPSVNWLIKDGYLYIPKNDYFLLGDNLNNSLDSRHYGLVHREHVIGHVLGVIHRGN